MLERNKTIPAVYLILEKDGQILLGRRQNTGFQDGNYQVPAGHVEAGELPTEALIREAKEEINITIRPEDLEFVHVSYRPRHDQTDNRIDLFFRARHWEGEVKNLEPQKCDDLHWFRELPANTIPHMTDALESIRRGVFFREHDLAWIKQHGMYRL